MFAVFQNTRFNICAWNMTLYYCYALNVIMTSLLRHCDVIITSLSLLLQELELSAASIEEIQGFARDFDGTARPARIPESSWVSNKKLLCFYCTARNGVTRLSLCLLWKLLVFSTTSVW